MAQYIRRFINIPMNTSRYYMSRRGYVTTPPGKTPNKNPTKEALLNHSHNLLANNVYCCGTGCYDCAWILYLNSLEHHLKMVKLTHHGDLDVVRAELKNKLRGAEPWIKNFVTDDMVFREVI